MYYTYENWIETLTGLDGNSHLETLLSLSLSCHRHHFLWIMHGPPFKQSLSALHNTCLFDFAVLAQCTDPCEFRTVFGYVLFYSCRWALSPLSPSFSSLHLVSYKAHCNAHVQHWPSEYLICCLCPYVTPVMKAVQYLGYYLFKLLKTLIQMVEEKNSHMCLR